MPAANCFSGIHWPKTLNPGGGAGLEPEPELEPQAKSVIDSKPSKQRCIQFIVFSNMLSIGTLDYIKQF
jgi:hypothetical protein